MAVKSELDAAPDAAVGGAASSRSPAQPRADAGSFAALRTALKRVPGDLVGVAVLLIFTVVLAWPPLAMEWALGRTDALIYFIPMWGHLGDRLAAGDIPAWSAAQFAGMPFVGDPESGWMYLPVMLAATLMPAVAAFKVLVLFHLALAALGTFALGRMLGLGLLAAVVAGTAYEFSALLEFTRCCTAYVQVMAWLPWALLGVELAIRAARWLPRVASWTLAGFAISQMLGAWMGQGAYNALLVVGGFVLYRTVLSPPNGTGPLRETLRPRLVAMVMNGVAVLVIGVALGAAGVLPRLEANEHSTLAGGVYDGAAAPYAVRDAWYPVLGVDLLLSIEANGLRYYAGGATLVLAFAAVWLAGRRFGVPFFAVVATVSFVLALEETPLHRLFYLLPRFQVIHEHYPERALIVLYLPLAMLAGAAVQVLPRWTNRPWALLLVGGVPLVGLLAAQGYLEYGERSTIDQWTPIMVAVVAGLLAIYALVRVDWVRRLVPVALLFAVLADPNGLRALFDNEWHEGRGEEAGQMLDAYQSEEGAAGFLQDRLEGGPVRYTGYDIHAAGPGFTYHSSFQWKVVPYILVNNRATYVGLQDLSGYNPLQHERFRELLDALNRGQPQDYHQTNLLTAGLDSPLLDLFNVRYIVIPNASAETVEQREDFKFLLRIYPTVYEDQRVKVLENPDALPRAWLVHQAKTVEPGAALGHLTTGAVDFRTTAVLEEPAPPLAPPANPANDRVEITHYEDDRVTLAAHSDAPSLVMLSDTYDPNWKAYVDGEEVDVLIADHALRAIPLPAGEHTIEMRFEPVALTAGIGISLGTVALLTGTLGVLGGARWRRTRSTDVIGG